MNDEPFSIKASPVNLEGIHELAQHFPDNDWRELRIYFRKIPPRAIRTEQQQKFPVEVRVAKNLNKVSIPGA